MVGEYEPSARISYDRWRVAADKSFHGVPAAERSRRLAKLLRAWQARLIEHRTMAHPRLGSWSQEQIAHLAEYIRCIETERVS